MCELTRAANIYYGHHARLTYATEQTPVQKLKLWMDNCSSGYHALREAKGDIPSFAVEFHNFVGDGFRIVDGRIEGDLDQVRRFAQKESGIPSVLTEESCRTFERSLFLLHLAEFHEKLSPLAAQKTEQAPKPAPAPRVQAAPQKPLSLFEMAGILS